MLDMDIRFIKTKGIMKKIMLMVAIAAFTTGAFAQTAPAQKANKETTKEVKANAKTHEHKKAVNKKSKANKAEAKPTKKSE